MDNKKNNVKLSLSVPSQFKTKKKKAQRTGITTETTEQNKLKRQLKVPSSFSEKIEGNSVDGRQFPFHKELERLEEQNRRLEENIATNAKISQVHESESLQLEKVTSLYDDMHKEQHRNIEMQSSMQKQIEKQSNFIEKQTEQIFNLQSEFGNEHEKHRRKEQRLTDELKEMKLYYEKDIESNQNIKLINLSELSDLKKQMHDTTVSYKRKIDSLNGELEEQKADNRSLCERVRLLKNEKDAIVIQFNESRRKDKEKFDVDFNQVLDNQKTLNKKIAALNESEREKDTIILDMKSNYENSKNENKELKQLLENKENCLSDNNGKIKQLTIDTGNLVKQSQKNLKEQELNNKKIIKEKENDFRMKLEEINSTRVRLQDKVNDKTAELETAKKTIQQLQAYMGDKLTDIQSQRVEEEIKRLKLECEHLKETCNVLESTNVLLNVRLSSLTNILHIQDTEMNCNGVYLDGQKADVLLKKWREKVYALLVQMKSQEINEHEELGKLKQQLTNTQKSLNDSQAQNDIFSHQLIEKKAELQIRENAIRAAEIELKTLHSKQVEVDEICSSYEDNFAKLFGGLQKNYTMVLEKGKNIDTALSTLQSLGGRVDFANSRLEFITGQFNRRENQYQERIAKLKEKEQQDSNVESVEGYPDDMQRLSRKDLIKEVNYLTKERRLLQGQFQEDVQNKISHVKLKFENNLKIKEEKVYELETSLKEEKVHKKKFQEELDAANEELKEASESLETLKTDLGKIKKEAEKEISSKLGQEREKYQEEYVKLENIVNAARQEHTKAIINLRLIEKKFDWEKKKTAEILSRQQEEYESKIHKLNNKMKMLEKERNLLLTTVRQSLKVPRERPALLDTSVESETEYLISMENSSRKGKKKRSSNIKPNETSIPIGSNEQSSGMLGGRNNPQIISKALADLCASIQINEKESGEDIPCSSTCAEY